jgi:hypothetical protein
MSVHAASDADMPLGDLNRQLEFQYQGNYPVLGT